MIPSKHFPYSHPSYPASYYVANGRQLYLPSPAYPASHNLQIFLFLPPFLIIVILTPFLTCGGPWMRKVDGCEAEARRIDTHLDQIQSMYVMSVLSLLCMYVCDLRKLVKLF